MGKQIDINRVIRGSACEVSLDSLTKRGVKQVKVVNQVAITKLISQTIDTVLSERQQEISATEREKVLEMAKTQVNNLARKNREQDQRTIGDLQQANQSLTMENERQATEIQRLQTEIARLSSSERSNLSAASANAGAVAQLLTLVGAQLQKSQTPQANVDQDVLSALNTLNAKVEKLKVAGGGGGAEVNVPDNVAIEFLINKDDEVETNLNTVEVKQKTAGDVKGALDKLKELQKGGD
ncbi:MAG: hypothetical protein MK538_05845 [Planctomycetes bacterium]|nr:hypothetical protein [Planctomycetota bacterium]